MAPHQLHSKQKLKLGRVIKIMWPAFALKIWDVARRSKKVDNLIIIIIKAAPFLKTKLVYYRSSECYTEVAKVDF